MICYQSNQGVAALFPVGRCLACHLQIQPKRERRSSVRERVNARILPKPQEAKRCAEPKKARDLKDVRGALGDRKSTNHKSQIILRRRLERIEVLKVIESRIRDLILKTEDKSKIAAYLEAIEIVQDQRVAFRRR